MPNPDIKAPLGSQDAERLRRWKSEFAQDFQFHKKWLERKEEWESFYDGDQLTSEEKRTLRKRKQPEVVINIIKPNIDGVIGDFFGRRVMMRARDRGTADFETAKHITEALRYVEDQTKFDEQESQVAEDLFVSGVGWYKEHLEFDFLEPELRISYRPNEDIIVDRKSRRRDLIDAKRLYETVWVEAEDLIELYPQFKQQIMEAVNKESQDILAQNKLVEHIGDDYDQSNNITPSVGLEFEMFVDPKRKRIRLINIWERVPKKTEFAFHPDIEGSVQEVTDLDSDEMSALKKNFKGVQFFTRKRWELNSGIFILNEVLEYKENVREHDSEGKFPFARAIGHVEKKTLAPYGLVKQYIDPQKEYNKRRSKLLHKSNTNRILAESGAFLDDDIERIRREAAKPDGVILYKTGKKFQIDDGRPDQVDLFMLQLAQGEIDSSGPPKEFIGTENKELSGKAINLRQSFGSKMIRRYFSALREARRDIFAIVLEDMQQFWTSEKLIKITDDPDAKAIPLNQRVINPQTNEVVIINDLRLGKYDIKVDEDTETPNQRQENFRWLAQLSDSILKSGQPFPVEELIRASDMPGKSDLIGKIEQEKQRQLQIAQANAIAAQSNAAAAQQNGQDVTPT